MKLSRIFINLLSIIIGLYILHHTFLFYIASTQCLQYQVVWAECRNEAYFGIAVLLVVVLLNMLNIVRINKDRNGLR